MLSERHTQFPPATSQCLAPRRTAATRRRMEQRRAERLALEEEARLQAPFTWFLALLTRCTSAVRVFAASAVAAGRARSSAD